MPAGSGETSSSISRTFIIPTPVSGAKRSTWSNLVPINKITIFHPLSRRVSTRGVTPTRETWKDGEGGEEDGGGWKTEKFVTLVTGYRVPIR